MPEAWLRNVLQRRTRNCVGNYLVTPDLTGAATRLSILGSRKQVFDLCHRTFGGSTSSHEPSPILETRHRSGGRRGRADLGDQTPGLADRRKHEFHRPEHQ